MLLPTFIKDKNKSMGVNISPAGISGLILITGHGMIP